MASKCSMNLLVLIMEVCMIGSIRRKKSRPSGSSNRIHELYGANLWRAPHNPFWPESGVGLASEFGVGDDGDFCMMNLVT